MRLAGAMTIHQGMQPQFAEMVINDLARHVDALFILENGDAPPEARLAAQNCPKLAGYERVDFGYNSRDAISIGHELHGRLFAMLALAKPEMVLFPDADELLPENIEYAIWLMKDNAAMCVEFPVLVCVGDENHVIGNASIHAKHHGPQVTLCTWRPGKFDFAPGYNYPAADYVGRGVVMPLPKRHLYVATPAAWRARYLFKPQSWMVQPWNVVAYDPQRTWAEWLKTTTKEEITTENTKYTEGNGQ